MSNTVFVPLAKNKACALIDACDAERVLALPWYAVTSHRTVYAAHSYKDGQMTRRVFLHRFVYGESDAYAIDHINRDGLDCRRTNLRPATHTESGANRGVFVTNKSGYKGVHLLPSGKWRGAIAHQHLGCFLRAEDAARAVDARAIELYGSFAFLNFPDDDGRKRHEQRGH